MKSVLALFCCLVLSGCGFQLLEPNVAPLTLKVAVRADSAPLLAAALRSRLRLRGLAQSSTEPDRIVSLRAEATDRRLLAIDSNGRAAEYREEHVVQVRANWADEQPGDWEEYRGIRDYAYDESVVLGKSQERQLILRELRIELADRIIENLIYDATDTPASTPVSPQDDTATATPPAE